MNCGSIPINTYIHVGVLGLHWFLPLPFRRGEGNFAVRPLGLFFDHRVVHAATRRQISVTFTRARN